MLKTVKIKRWGNSQGIMLSKQMLNAMGIDDPKNQEFYLSIKDGELILRKKTSSRLAQNFGHIEQYKPVSGQREYGWDNSYGREL
ncbi:hypothetical protein EQ500_05805 [Lactobacillus sp. XV13L]|nr:hypothetical protein [Lactobacillus sp. XV13L]